MAGIPTYNQIRQTILRDEQGNPIVVVRDGKFTVMGPGNALSEYQIDDHIQLVDNLQWNPSLGSGANPILLTRCTVCIKSRKSHGLLSVRNARLCGCGRTTCPRHRRLLDGCWRCPKWAMIHRLVLPLFFRKGSE